MSGRRQKHRSKKADCGPPKKDNKKDNFTTQQLDLLHALTRHESITHLAKATNRRKDSVARSLRILMRDGFVDHRHRKYFLTQKGLQIASRFKDNLSHVATPPKSGGGHSREKVNLHDVCFKVELLRRPPRWRERMGVCFNLEVSEDLVSKKFSPGFQGGRGMASLRFVDFTVQCFADYLLVWVPGVVDFPGEATRRVFNYLINLLPKLERRLGIPYQCLYKGGYLNVKLSSSHYARMECEFARWNAVSGKDLIKVRAPDGRIRLLVDHSEGFETEAVHPDLGQSDIERVNELIADIGEDRVAQYFDEYLEGKAMLPSKVNYLLGQAFAGLSALATAVKRQYDSNVELNSSLHELLEKNNGNSKPEPKSGSGGSGRDCVEDFFRGYR